MNVESLAPLLRYDADLFEWALPFGDFTSKADDNHLLNGILRYSAQSIFTPIFKDESNSFS